MERNLILETLPDEARAAIMRHSTRVELDQYDLIQRCGCATEDVYFVLSGAVSLLHVSSDGKVIETGVVGQEGAVGSVIALGSLESSRQATVQIRTSALRLAAEDFLNLVGEWSGLASQVHRHIDFLLFQAQQNAVCHALHSVEARFCRRLLQASDASDSNLLELTQEFCSRILGVQRTSVSMVAHALQSAGYIRTRRGKIEILVRPQLLAAACECYEILKRRSESLTRLESEEQSAIPPPADK